MQTRSHRPDLESDADWRLPTDVSTVRTKLVYLYLSAEQRAAVDEISRAVREPQLRLYPALEYLVERGHVERHGSAFTLVES